jgi:hypothetical protein
MEPIAGNSSPASHAQMQRVTADSSHHATSWTGRGVSATARFKAVRGVVVAALAGVLVMAGNVHAQTSDFGDYSGFGSASSTVNSNMKIGVLIDAESSAVTNATATGDDNNGVDDEDGVTLPQFLIRGQSASITVNVSNNRGGTSYLNAWIDYDRNGTLASGERIASNLTVANGTTNSNRVINFTVPSTASVGTTCVRVRLTSSGTSNSTGSVGSGEVEDHLITIIDPTDFGDYSAFAAASSVVNSNLRIGEAVDMEATATTNSSATGDDITGSDDEDGVTVPVYLSQGTASSLVVNVTNTSGSAAYLNVWIDFNGNGVLTDAGEQLASNTVIANGTSNSNRTVSFTVPANASPGVAGVRVRLTSTSSPGPTGASGNGEVEDYITTIVTSSDFGDFSLFDPAFSTLSNAIKMGALVDAESLVTNATATGDDITGSDDEDGVTLPTGLVQGQTGQTVTVKVTNTSGAEVYLNGWIDFNNNGVLTDPGEQIIINDPMTTGINGVNKAYTFTVPTVAAIGTVGARFRLTSIPNPGSTGSSGTGEAEDYTITIAEPSDRGDYSLFQDASSKISSALKLGDFTDAEFTAATNLAATGDDINNINDEDGTTVQAILVRGQAGVAVTVNVTNLSGAPAYLNGWADFNNNGSLTDTDEQIVTNVVVPAGTTSDYQTFFFDVPSTASLGTIGTRFRLTSVSAPGPVGASGNGEVEDYTTTIVAPSSNFRDYFYAIRSNNGNFYLDEVSVYNPNSATPTVSVTQGILNLNTATSGYNASATNAYMNGLALDWLNRRFYWNSSSAGSSGYNYQLNTAHYDNVTKTWSYQTVTGSSLSNIPYNTGSPNSSSAGSGAFPRAAYYAGDYYGGGQNNDNVVAWRLDSTGKALRSPAFNDYPNFFHRTQKFGGGDFVIRPQDGLLVTSTAVDNTTNTLFNQFMTDGFNSGGPAATSININTQIPVSSNSAVQIAGVGGVTRLYGVASTSATLYRLDNYDTSTPVAVRVGTLPTGSSLKYDDLSEGISSSVTSLGVKGIVYEDTNGLADNTVGGTGSNVGGTLFALLVDGSGNLVDSFPVKEDGTFILGGATANTSYTVVLSTSLGSLGGAAPTADLPQGWFNTGEFLGSGAGSDGTVNGRLSVTVGTNGLVNAKLGISQATSVGNLVWNDANNNGLKEAGESGISGVTVQLWTPGVDNAIGGSGTAADTLIATTTTDGTGAYGFTNRPPGKYYLCLTPPVLYSLASITAGADNGVDNDNNGSQPGGAGTSVYSPVVDLAVGKEPGNLASGGIDIDNTIDFGLLKAMDYGDHSLFGSASSAVVPSLHLGILNDSEYSAFTNVSATGDDLNGVDDEDGVAVPSSIAPGASGALTVTVTNTSGSSAFLHAWIDFNRDGVLTDVGERVANNVLVANGTSNSNRTISFTVPASATFGVAGVRVRLTSVSTPGPTGALGNGEVEDYVMTIGCPTVTVTTASLPAGSVSSAYSQTLTASGGSPPYTWALATGTLPAGLSLNTSTGVISGSPTTGNGASTSLGFRATDANGCQANATLSLQVCPLITLSPSTLATPTVGVSYSQTIGATGGAAPYAFSIASGSLPAWASLSSAGVLSGTPASSTSASFTVRVTDANGCVKTLAFTLAASCPAIGITPATLSQAFIGTAYSQTLAPSNGVAPYAWEQTSGTLPTGLSFNATTGVISGTPTATVNSASLGFRVTDANGCQGIAALNLQVCPVITMTPGTLPAGVVGTAYSQTISSSGGVAPYTYMLASGTLPTGLSLSNAGVINGTPTTSNGTGVNITVRATDANGCTKNQIFSLKVCPVISLGAISTTTSVGTSYSQTIGATGGATPHVFAVAIGSLPDGLSLNTSTGVLSGTPTSPVPQTFTIRATDANGCVGSRVYTLEPQCSVLSVSPGTPSVGIVGSAYSQTFISAGGKSPYSYAVSSGTLPAGLSLGTGGVLSGTPTAAGSSTVTLTVTDANSCQSSFTRVIIISNAPADCPTPSGETNGGRYLATRVGRDVFGGETQSQGNCIFNMSPDGRWITGIRFGLKTRGFVMNTLSLTNVDIPLVNAAHPYAMGGDVNDGGNVVGHEKWTAGSKFNVIPWFYNRASGTVTRLLTPYDGNASVYALPTALTADSAFAFGTTDPDGPSGPLMPQGGWWNLSTRAWTAISGVREVLDASADGTKLLVIDSSGVGKVISGSPAGGWGTTVVTFTGGSLRGGRISPNGRYVGSSQRISGVPVPFVYDTQTSTRTNLARIMPQDKLGGIVGAISDTGRALGSIYSSGSSGSFAVMWDTPADLYTRISDLLIDDGHVAQDASYAFWNIYNGGDGISADGTMMGVYGNNPSAIEDSILFSRIPQPDARLCLGNAVWQDTDRDGIKDVGEPGVAGAVVRLFHPGADGVRGGTGVNADYEVAPPITTTSSGAYVFSAVPAGVYYVQVTPTASLPATSGAVVPFDNGVNNDNNGLQPGGPGTPIFSPLITLAPGTNRSTTATPIPTPSCPSTLVSVTA